jgi:heme/copper-type cytochrome/quinol oxidase subunit 2
MKKIISKHIPFAGYKAMTVWPFIFIRNGMAWAYDERTNRHEHIHGRQQVEMLIASILIVIVLFVVGCGWWSLLTLPIFFYWYGIEYLIRWVHYKNQNNAYRNIAFEREAY